MTTIGIIIASILLMQLMVKLLDMFNKRTKKIKLTKDQIAQNKINDLQKQMINLQKELNK